MTFTCPYCGSETKVVLLGNMAFGHARCSACGRKFRFMPMAIKDECKPAWDRAINEVRGTGLVWLIVVAVVIGLICVIVR